MAANAFGKSTIELWLIITQHVCGWCDAATKPIFIIPFCTSVDVASHFHIFVSPGGRGLYEYFDFFFSLFVCCCGCFVILTARNVLICTDMSGIFFLLFVVFVRAAVEMLTTLSYQSYFCDGGGGGGCKCDQCWAIIEKEKKNTKKYAAFSRKRAVTVATAAAETKIYFYRRQSAMSSWDWKSRSLCICILKYRPFCNINIMHNLP